MKNKLPILAVILIVVLPLLVIPSQKNLPAYAETSSHPFTVTAPVLNVREEANLSGKIIGKVHQWDTIEIIQSKNNWDQIKLSGNRTGWVYDAYVTPAENITAAVDAVNLNVREKPGLSGRVKSTLKPGSIITIYAEHAGWAKIGSSSGVQGWVNEKYLVKDSSAGTQVSQTAGNTTDSSQTTSQDRLSQSTNSGMDPSMNSSLMPASQEPLYGKTIVLDPGHGGNDNGTTGITGTHEKTLTLATAQTVEQKLVSAGANVIMTRTSDTYIPLQNRADLSNQNHADAFISIHYNWSNDPTVNGITDFYYQKSKDNRLASAILTDVAKTTGLTNDGTKFDNLEVLRNNSQPSTLIELGFLSNQQDESTVENSSYREGVAQGVYQGLLDYFSSKN